MSQITQIHPYLIIAIRIRIISSATKKLQKQMEK